MIEHVLDLGNQLKKDLETSNDFVIDSYKDLLIIGMGGSGVAGDALKLVLNETTQINVEVRKAYGIPKAIAERRPKCLFISYSGNTEETLEAVNDAINYDLDWSVISSGGQLLELASKNKKPYVKLPTGLQPRAAFGLMTKAVMHFVSSDRDGEYLKLCNQAGDYLNEALGNQSENKLLSHALKISKEISTKTSVIYGGTPLTYLVAQRWKTQINENAKSKAFVGYMPEIHHNEILSWEANKEDSKNNYHLLFLRSSNENSQISKRFELTKKIIGDKVKISEIENISTENVISNLFHLTLIGDLVSVYMAENLNIDPYDITAIEDLKKLLKE
ncbi:MAG: bifunctional phosphoglucose/phosphomannose isomerase [Candidatus Actinomarina sp.]